METTTYHESAFKIYFDFSPGEPMTNDYPGSPPEFEVYKVELYGKELDADQLEKFITDYGQIELDELCQEEIENARQEKEEFDADLKYNERGF